MGRQIVFTFEGDDKYCGVHFDWMCLPCTPCIPPAYRHIRYNAVDCNGNWCWPIGPCGGKVIDYENGGYPNIEVTHYGAAIPTFHHGPDADQYRSYLYLDLNPCLGFWVGASNPGPLDSDPVPNCQEIYTGNYETGSPSSQYIWPKSEYDVCADDSIIHKVATESPPTGAPAGEIQTVVYYRDVWDSPTQSIVAPACGMFVDSMYNITVIVRQDPLTEEVAIVWGKPVYYDGDPNDPCGFTQWQNDIIVWKSFDCGVTWNDVDKENITDYTVGGTVPINTLTHMFYTDLSAVYDHDGILHVVWSTPLRDPTEDGCQPLYSSRVWHWDDFNDDISLVYDASRPRFFLDPGAWNNSTCKVNVSECYVQSVKRMYVTFTRFGAHADASGDTSVDASAGGYENGEIFITGSTDGGVTWGPDPAAPAYGGCVADGPPCQEATTASGTAINLTNTCSPGCATGDCFSEHWSSMAKYSRDSVYIEYILDKDAGGFPQTEGELTCNPVMYATYPCFEPAEICQLGYSPIEVGYPVFIAPDGEPDRIVPVPIRPLSI
jgi:hypothetical protein